MIITFRFGALTAIPGTTAAIARSIDRSPRIHYVHEATTYKGFVPIVLTLLGTRHAGHHTPAGRHHHALH